MRALRLLVIDLAALLLAGYASLFIRDNLDFSADHFASLTPYIIFSALAGLVILPILGVNRSVWRYSTFEDFLRIAGGCLLIVLVATTLSFAYNRMDNLFRSLPLLHFILSVAFMSVTRGTIRIVHEMRSRPQAKPVTPEDPSAEQVLIIGINVVAALFARSVREYAKDRIHLVGLLGSNDRHRGGLLQGIPILGHPEEVEQVLLQLDVHGVTVDRIVVAKPRGELSAAVLEALGSIEAGSEVRVDYFSDRLGFAPAPEPREAPQVSGPGSTVVRDDTLPSLRNVLDQAVLSQPYWRWKRLFDIAVSSTLILLTLPVMAVVSLIVFLDVGNPVVFWQQRPGVCGKRMKLYKFRTMRGAHDSQGNRIPEETRVSGVGRFLRRSRLDELPQLFNILVGEMSFVGPRPLLPVDQCPGFSGRLAVRPGLTGWAQVNGGRQISALDKATMDLWYIRNASFLLDMRIAFMTLRMLIVGERADHKAIADAWRDIEAWRTGLSQA